MRIGDLRSGSGAASRVLTVAEMQTRDLGRRGLALMILVALPLAFYLSVPADDPFALVAGGAGMVWAISVAGLFAVLGSRRADPRLVLSIMREESRFNPRAKSQAAARGLLQFILATARDIGRDIGLVDVDAVGLASIND